MGWLEDALAQQPDYVSQDPMAVMNQLTPTPPRDQAAIDSSTGMLSKILDTGGKAVGILTHTLAAPLNVARLVDEGLRGVTGHSRNEMLIHQAVPNYAALYQQTAQIDPATGKVNPGPVGNLLNSQNFADVRGMVKKQVMTGANPALAAGLLGDPTRDGMEIPTISENPIYALTGTITGERPARLAEIEAAGRVLMGGTKSFPNALKEYEGINTQTADTFQKRTAALQNLAQARTIEDLRPEQIRSEHAQGSERLAHTGLYGAQTLTENQMRPEVVRGAKNTADLTGERILTEQQDRPPKILLTTNRAAEVAAHTREVEARTQNLQTEGGFIPALRQIDIEKGLGNIDVSGARADSIRGMLPYQQSNLEARTNRTVQQMQTDAAMAEGNLRRIDAQVATLEATGALQGARTQLTGALTDLTNVRRGATADAATSMQSLRSAQEKLMTLRMGLAEAAQMNRDATTNAKIQQIDSDIMRTTNLMNLDDARTAGALAGGGKGGTFSTSREGALMRMTTGDRKMYLESLSPQGRLEALGVPEQNIEDTRGLFAKLRGDKPLLRVKGGTLPGSGGGGEDDGQVQSFIDNLKASGATPQVVRSSVLRKYPRWAAANGIR